MTNNFKTYYEIKRKATRFAMFNFCEIRQLQRLMKENIAIKQAAVRDDKNNESL